MTVSYNLVYRILTKNGIRSPKHQKPEVVENRLQVYSKTAEELINHYEEAGILYNAKAGDKVGKTSYDVAKEVEDYIRK